MRDCLIWTPDGSWLQSRKTGRLVASYLGRVGTLEELQEYAHWMGLDFCQYPPPPGASTNRPGRRPSPAVQAANFCGTNA